MKPIIASLAIIAIVLAGCANKQPRPMHSPKANQKNPYVNYVNEEAWTKTTGIKPSSPPEPAPIAPLEDQLAKCFGVWKARAKHMKEVAGPANEEISRNYGRSAELAAIQVIIEKSAARNTSPTQKEINAYINKRADEADLFLSARYELVRSVSPDDLDNIKKINDEVNHCKNLFEQQEEILIRIKK